MAGKPPKTGAEAAAARRFLNARQRRFYEAIWPALLLMERHAPYNNNVIFSHQDCWDAVMTFLEESGEYSPEEMKGLRQNDTLGVLSLQDKLVTLATPADLTQALGEVSFDNFPPHPAQDYFHLASMFDSHLRFAGFSDRFYLTAAPMPDLWRATHDDPPLNPGQQRSLDAGRAVYAFFQARGLWGQVKPRTDQHHSMPQAL